jgi:hypothetical protein
VAAVVAGSDAMMADSAAMMIDAMTYFCNSLAERQKVNYRTSLQKLQQKQKQVQQRQQQPQKRERHRRKHHHPNQEAHHLLTLPIQEEKQKQEGTHQHSTSVDDDDIRVTELKDFTFQHYHSQPQQQLHDEDEEEDITQMQILTYQYKMRLLHMELIPPLISVSALLVVTIVVAQKAIHELSLERDVDNNNNSSDIKNPIGPTAAGPDLQLMTLFSVLNLGLDGLNVFCFAKADHATGYSTMAMSSPTMAKNNMEVYHDGHESGWTPHSRDDGRRLFKAGNKSNEAEHPSKKHASARRICEQHLTSESPRPAPPPPTTTIAAQQVTNASDETFRAATMNTKRNGIHEKNSRDVIITATSPRKTIIPLEIEDYQYSNYPDDNNSRAEDVNHDHGSNLNMCSAYTVGFFPQSCDEYIAELVYVDTLDEKRQGRD